MALEVLTLGRLFQVAVCSLLPFTPLADAWDMGMMVGSEELPSTTRQKYGYNYGMFKKTQENNLQAIKTQILLYYHHWIREEKQMLCYQILLQSVNL